MKTKEQIATIFGIQSRHIQFTEGDKELKTKDTYEFTTVGVSFDKINKAIKEIPNIKLGDCVVTSGKVVLRIG